MSTGVAEQIVFVDHYRVLGIDFSATPSDVRAAFRQLARRHHPDHAGGDGLRFIEIYSAYRVLYDPASRARYDERYRSLHAPRPADPPDLYIPATRLKFPGDIASLAKRGLLRKKIRNRQRRRALNIDYDLELHLSSAEFERPLRVSVPVIARTLCPDCRGSDQNCPACSGRGYYKKSHTILLKLAGGLTDGQVLEIDLQGLRPGPLSHFKRRKLRIKITGPDRAPRNRSTHNRVSADQRA